MNFVAATCLIGCLSTKLTPGKIQEESERLASLAGKEVFLEVSTDNVKGVAGHQYLFFFIPFGEVSTPHIAQSTGAAFYEALALKGVRALPQLRAQINTVRVAVLSLRITAYDFFFFRRVVCSLEIEGSLIDVDGAPRRTWRTVIRQVDTVRFAFRADLERILDEAIEESSTEIVNELFRVSP